MWDMCWLIDGFWTSLRIEARAHGEIQDNVLLRAPAMILKMPWNTIFNYGSIDHSIVRELTLLGLKTAHPDTKDITFKGLEKDLMITATNLTDSYFFVGSKKILRTRL